MTKKCKIPDDCWGCFEYNNCDKIQDWKGVNPARFIPIVLMAIISAILVSGIVYMVTKFAKFLMGAL